MTDRNLGGHLDLDHLRTFLAVYRAGSISRGARTLGLAQGTVSAQLQALEARVGQRLFVRQARGVSATPLGDELAARVAGPLDVISAVSNGLLGTGGPGEPQPAVRLGGPAELLATTALPALAPLIEEGVRLRVTAGLVDDLLDDLTAGRLDLVLSTIRPRGRALRVEPLADEEFMLVAAPEVADRLLPVRSAQDLAKARLLAYADDLPILRRYWRHVFDQRLEATAHVVVADLRAITSLVVSGAGISVLPRYLCQGLVERGALTLLHEPADAPINTLFLVGRHRGQPAPHVQRVHDVLLAAGASWAL